MLSLKLIMNNERYQHNMSVILPSLSLMPTTMVRVVPRGTMPATGSAQGPLPCCISIQQSTLSPEAVDIIDDYRCRYLSSG